MIVTVLELNKPTINGRIYTKEVFEKSFSDITTKWLITTEPNWDGRTIELSSCIGIAEIISIQPNAVTADVTFLKEVYIQLLQEKMIVLRPYGLGQVFEEDGKMVVCNYTLKGFQVYHRPK